MKSSLTKKIEALPPDLQQEVDDFVQFLIEKKARKQRKKLKLDWAGALKDLRKEYTSVDLQHQILAGWGD